MPVDFRVPCRAGREEVRVAARVYEADESATAWLVLAPGAGAGHDHPFMKTFGRGLSQRGLHVVTFNFPYIERGRRVPDGNEVLEACWRSVLESVHEKAQGALPLFAGGKSMGGRIASQVAAASEVATRLNGLVFLGYPLHPPGRPERPRTAHWPAIHVPALFVQGERDPFATPEEIRTAAAEYGARTTIEIVDEGDHSFKVPKRSGRSQESVYADIQDRVVAWIRDVT